MCQFAQRKQLEFLRQLSVFEQKKIFGISCMLFSGSDQRIVSKALE